MKFAKIFKKIFFDETPPVAASDFSGDYRLASLAYAVKWKETYRFKPHHQANSIYLACAYLKSRQTSMMELFRGNS